MGNQKIYEVPEDGNGNVQCDQLAEKTPVPLVINPRAANVLEELPIVYNLDLPVGVLEEDGTIRKPAYTQKNIHEFVLAWSRGELVALP